MLVLDSFRWHIMERVKRAVANADCQFVIIPGGLTPVLQPLDVALNKPFKNRVAAHYNEWVEQDGKPQTPTGRVKRASLSTVAQCVPQWVPASQHGVRSFY